MTPFASDAVQNAFDGFPAGDRDTLLTVREMIFEIAAEVPAIRRLEENLKWGQPSYAALPKTGTPIRLGLSGDRAACFVHCQTSLVSDHARIAPPDIELLDNRALILPGPDAEEQAFLCSFLRAALTYHSKGAE